MTQPPINVTLKNRDISLDDNELVFLITYEEAYLTYSINTLNFFKSINKGVLHEFVYDREALIFNEGEFTLIHKDELNTSISIKGEKVVLPTLDVIRGLYKALSVINGTLFSMGYWTLEEYLFHNHADFFIDPSLGIALFFNTISPNIIFGWNEELFKELCSNFSKKEDFGFDDLTYFFRYMPLAEDIYHLDYLLKDSPELSSIRPYYLGIGDIPTSLVELPGWEYLPNLNPEYKGVLQQAIANKIQSIAGDGDWNEAVKVYLNHLENYILENK